MENHNVATGLSIPMLCLSVIWNFIYFTIHFEIAIQKPYYHYLSLPAFWYFMVSFVFEFRLLILCWRAQYVLPNNFDTNTIRRKLVAFYIRFYFTCLLLYIFNTLIIYNSALLFMFNASIWLPQIYRNYKKRCRQTPDMSFAVALTCCHSFLPIYMRGCPYNLLDKQPDLMMASCLIMYLGLQLGIMYL